MDQLYDDSKTVVLVCAILTPICVLLAGLRLWVRWRNKCLGIDDYLFVAGLTFWIVSIAFCITGCWYGIGAHAEHYTKEQGILGVKWFFLWQDFYAWANMMIKVSLCLTLIRISNQRWFSYTLYFLMFVMCSATLVTNIYLLTTCVPLEAVWNTELPGASCRPGSDTVKLGNAWSAINITVDWLIALLPVFLLWKVQLPWKQKVSAMVILALGIFASSATLLRLGPLANFANPEDYLFGLGPIVWWTIVEVSLALIAGSLLTLRPLFRRWFGTQSTSSGQTPAHPYGPSRHDNFVRTGSRDSHIGLDTIIHSGEDGWKRDTDSQRSIIDRDNIHVVKTFEMT